MEAPKALACKEETVLSVGVGCTVVPVVVILVEAVEAAVLEARKEEMVPTAESYRMSSPCTCNVDNSRSCRWRTK